MANKLVLHEAVDVTYTKMVGGSGQLNRIASSVRTIIPTIIPPANIKALDVTGLTEAEISALEIQLAEYAEYYNAVANTIFSFDDWRELTYQQTGAKWRTFNKDGLVIKAD